MNELITAPANGGNFEEKEYQILNLGPTHPATHGIFQNILKMDGEITVGSESTMISPSIFRMF